MARVLLVENEGVWLKLIRQALPEHDVDSAQSFNEALALLGSDVAYDVSIVDLNLLPGDRNDGLGRELLKCMRDEYPTIRRVVLTGQPPTALRTIFEQYDLDDLLLKYRIDLSVVREVVEAALKRAAGDVSAKLRFAKLDLGNSLRSWKEPILQRIEQRAQSLRNDIQEAERIGKKADDSQKALTDLETRRHNLETEIGELLQRVASIRSDEDRRRAYEEFERLKAVYGG